MEKEKKRGRIVSKIPKWAWMLISFGAFMLLWYMLSIIPRTARTFPNVVVVIKSVGTMIQRGLLFRDIGSSLLSVILGFACGAVISIPVAFLMAWYLPVRKVIEPWIMFIRNIPPLAYVPLVVLAVGIGRKPQVIVITLAVFLVMSITIYQGVTNVDETLIKAARVLGANDKDMFIKVIFPATTPYIITAIRLGIATALTTLIAAESTGATAGLGMRIKALSNSYETAPMLLYIIIIGLIGMGAEKLLKLFERKVTGWQEKREI